jgi:hypothetical protein
MRPDQNALSAHGKVAHGPNHVRSPYPGAGKKNDAVNRVVLFHAFERRARFRFGGDHDIMFHQVDSCATQSSL